MCDSSLQHAQQNQNHCRKPFKSSQSKGTKPYIFGLRPCAENHTMHIALPSITMQI